MREQLRHGLWGPAPMRTLVVFLVLLAGAKFGYQEWVYRNALADTLITTYRIDASEACQREAARRNLKLDYVSWTQPESLELVVGQGALDPTAWAVGSGNRASRTSSPYLVIVARTKPFQIICEYDMVRQVASVTRM
mgnify:CR=1 FL=1